MFRTLSVLATIAICGAAIVPQENRDQQQQKQQQQPSVQNTNQGYSSVPGNHQSQYYYPTYPDYSKTGYAVQTGYEGYLVPVSSSQRNPHWTSGLASSLLPVSTSLLAYSARLGTYILQFLFIVLLGSAFTTLVCTFTPLCTISFLGLGFNKHHVKEQVAELARTYITPESVNAATILVTKAIDKYNALQREHQEKEKQEEKEKPVTEAQ